MSESSYEFLEESNFDGRDPAEIERIKNNARFDKFTLTNAIRPGLHFTPEEGFSCIYVDRKPGIIASVTRDKLGDLLKQCITVLPDSVGILLSHTVPGHDDPRTNGTGLVDRSILESALEDDDILDFLMNDGRTSLTVYDSDETGKTQLIFDEDKLLIFQGALKKFGQLLEGQGVVRKQNMVTIDRMAHWHLSTAEHNEKFEQVSQVLNLIDADYDDDDEPEDWEESLFD